MFAASTGHAQFGGLLGGKKKSAGTDKDAYIAQGKQLIQGYALMQSTLLEVGAAQAEAEGDNAKAEEYRVLAKTLADDPSTKDFDKVKQASEEIREKQSDTAKRSVEYTAKGKAALQKTLPKATASFAGGVALSVLSVKWLAEYPDQLKAAGTFGKLKLLKELKVPLYVAKEIPSALKTLPTLTKAMGHAKKQGVDVKDAEKQAAGIKL